MTETTQFVRACALGDVPDEGALGVEDIRTMDANASFGHVCTPEEVAEAVRWVVSPAASYVTGQRIGVDGGSS